MTIEDHTQKCSGENRAATHARAILRSYQSPPALLANPLPPLSDRPVQLQSSPYAGRRATIVFSAYDIPRGNAVLQTEEEHAASQTSIDETTSLVRVEPLPTANGNTFIDTAASTAATQLSCRRIQRKSSSPYSRLSYILGDYCLPFSAVTATMRAAGFELIAGRRALLHQTFSLLWVKTLLPSHTKAVVEHLRQFKKVNHFPETHRLGRKDRLHRQLQIAARRGATAKMQWSSIAPEGWLLPEDTEACVKALQSSGLFIAKPTNQAGGQGILLLRGDPQLKGLPPSLSMPPLPPKAVSSTATSSSFSIAATTSASTLRHPSPSSYIVQRYIPRPFLILGHKFDLRLYVVVTSFDPIRLYLYREGLVRIARHPYRTSSTASNGETTSSLADLTQLTAHLTNFTVNKGVTAAAENDAATTADSADSTELKWPLQALAAYMTSLQIDWSGTMARVHHLIAQTFLSVAPEVRAALRQFQMAYGGSNDGAPATTTRTSITAVAAPCTVQGISPFFEIYGVDVLLSHDKMADENAAAATLAPTLLEVNIMPSLSTHYSSLDQRIKANFIADTLTLVGLTSPLFKSNEGQGPPAVPCMASDFADAFLESLRRDGKYDLLEVCLTADEERRRAPNFDVVLPTAASCEAYAPLLSDEALQVQPSQYDAVLSRWMAHQAACNS